MSAGRIAALLVVLLSSAPCGAQERAAELTSPLRRSGSARQVEARGEAGAAPRAGGFALDLSVATTLPLVVGGTMGLEVPGHVVVRVGGGCVPGAYVDAINAVGVGWGAYDARSGQLASALLASAMWLELGLGLRPAGTPGIELSVSYVLLWSQGHVDPSAFGASTRQAGLDLTIDAVHGELAWQSEPVEHVYFRIAIGWAQAFDRHVALAAAGDTGEQAALRSAGDALSQTVARYAFGPTLGASLGMRLW